MRVVSKSGRAVARVIRPADMDVARRMWHHADVAKATDEQLAGIRDAVARLARAEAEIESARAALAQEIGKALKNGVRPVDVEDEVPYKREHIRRIAREQGVPPLRPPTATRIRSTERTTEG